MNTEPVSSAKRLFGWGITLVVGAGYFLFLAWLESLELPALILGVLFLPLGWGGWVLLLVLATKYDLLGDKKEN